MQHTHLNKESILKKRQSTYLSHKTHYNCHINEQKTNSIIRSSHQSILLL